MITAERCESLVRDLATAIDLAMEEGPDDVRVRTQVSRFHEQIRLAISEEGGGNISLEMRESLFVHNGVPLAGASIRGRSAIAFLRFADAGGLEFSGAVTETDVANIVRLAQGICGGEEWAYGDRRQVLLSGLRGARLTAPTDAVTWDWIDAGPAGDAYTSAGFELDRAAPVKRAVAEAIDGAMESARAGHSIETNESRTLAEQFATTSSDSFADLLHLAERPQFDVFTVQHSLRVTLFATYVASLLGARRDVLIELGSAAMLHDVGKGRIPESVLYKPGALDDDERRVIKEHPALGAEILLESTDLSPFVLGAAWGHHLRFDGRGYPEARPWFRRSPATSLIQICDVFEALTARRPYKAPYSPARALEILHSDRGAFDPAMLAAFTRAMGFYPPGRFVQLTSGAFARVVRAGKELDRPTVQVIPNGEVVDLRTIGRESLGVARILDEPEFVESMCHGGVATMSERDRIEADAAASEAARDDEVEMLGLDEWSDDGEDSGDDCRLC